MRNFLAGLSGGSGAFGAAAVVLVLIAAGYWVQSGRNDGTTDTDQVALVAQEPEAVVTPSTEVADATPEVEPMKSDPQEPEDAVEAAPEIEEETPVEQADEVETADAAQAEQPAPEPVAPTPAPAFDEVRREADGMTVIAGTAAPGADIQVLQNGVEVGRAVADGAGKFATLAMIPPDGKGHVLTLLQRFAGDEKLSDDEIILAPLSPVEVVVAQVEPTPTAQPETIEPAQPTPEEQVPEEQVIAQTDEDADTKPVATVQESPPAVTDVAEADVLTEPQEIVVTEPPSAPTNETVVQLPPATEENLPVVADAPQLVEETVSQPEEPVVVAESASENAAPAPAPPAPAPEPSPEVVAPEVPLISDEAAPEQPSVVAVLKSTQTGVELLNTPSPEVMKNVAIDTISYSDVGEVQLAGRAQTATKSVRVYLDNQSVINLPVDEQGRWRGELPDVDEGIYTLRVDEVTADGNVTSRVETPFKREAPEVLEAAAAGLEGPLKAITVQKGATLWAIARDRYGDGALYVRVFDANTASIRDPDLIYPGQVFDLPD